MGRINKGFLFLGSGSSSGSARNIKFGFEFGFIRFANNLKFGFEFGFGSKQKFATPLVSKQSKFVKSIRFVVFQGLKLKMSSLARDNLT